MTCAYAAIVDKNGFGLHLSAVYCSSAFDIARHGGQFTTSLIFTLFQRGMVWRWCYSLPGLDWVRLTSAWDYGSCSAAQVDIRLQCDDRTLEMVPDPCFLATDFACNDRVYLT